MRGAGNGGAGVGRLRRHVQSGVANDELSLDVQIVSPLDDFLCRHRSCKSLIFFSDLHVRCRKDFYGKAANYEMQFGLVSSRIFLKPKKSRESSELQSLLATARPSISQLVGTA